MKIHYRYMSVYREREEKTRRDICSASSGSKPHGERLIMLHQSSE